MVSPKSLLYRLNRRDTRLFPRLPIGGKIFLIFAIILSFKLVPHLIHGQEKTPSTNSVGYYQDAIKECQNQECWVSNAMGAQAMTTLNALLGEVDEPIKIKELNYRPKAPGGMIGAVNSLNSKLYAPPISGVEYIASSFQEFVGGRPVYAQGVGFVGLQSILPLWKAFRNIVYILSSFIVVIIGLMIMFRIKISPQAVVTIQNALPQLIITLLLVTFSYAIAGLLIDFSYFIQAAVLALLFDAQGRSLTQNLYFAETSLGNPFTFSNLANANLGTIFNVSFSLVPTAALGSLGALIGAVIGGVLGSAGGIGLGTVVGAGVGAILGEGIGVIIISIIFAVLILFWIIKLFFGLVKCYVTLIFKIILGPLEIGMGAFPSAKMGFNSWIMDIIANLAVFPITLLFLVIANIIVERSSGGLWAPNLLRSSIIGEFANGAANFSGGIIPVAIGLGALMLMAKLPELIPQAVFMLKPTAWESALGKSMDFSHNPMVNFAKATAKQQVIGPAITQLGERMGETDDKTFWGRLNRATGKNGRGIGQKIGPVLAGTEEHPGVGRKVSQGKL